MKRTFFLDRYKKIAVILGNIKLILKKKQSLFLLLTFFLSLVSSSSWGSSAFLDDLKSRTDEVKLSQGTLSALRKPPSFPPVGQQMILNFFGCQTPQFQCGDWVRQTLLETAEKAKATVVMTLFQETKLGGVSGVVVIAESHLAIRTFPSGYAAIDVFTCGDISFSTIQRNLLEKFQPTNHTILEIKRPFSENLGDISETLSPLQKSSLVQKDVLPVGQQLILELFDCQTTHFNEVDWIRFVLRQAVERADRKTTDSFHVFSPYGISGIVTNGEHLLAIHTWPEHYYAAVDLFDYSSGVSCDEGESRKFREGILSVLSRNFYPTKTQAIQFPRPFIQASLERTDLLAYSIQKKITSPPRESQTDLDLSAAPLKGHASSKTEAAAETS